MLFICDTIALAKLAMSKDDGVTLCCKPISLQQAKELIGFSSEVEDMINCIEGLDVENWFTNELGWILPQNATEAIRMRPHDIILWGRYTGPSGTTDTGLMPEGGRIEWIIVSLLANTQTHGMANLSFFEYN